MNNDFQEFDGFDELEKEVKNYLKNVSDEKIIDILEVGASEFVKILLKLPKPKSKINKSGYTHLVDSFSYKKRNSQIEVGWGKYYGPMVESGTRRMRAMPHMLPAFNKNRELIYKKMINKIGGF